MWKWLLSSALSDCGCDKDRFMEVYWAIIAFFWSHVATALVVSAMLAYHGKSSYRVGETSTSVLLLYVYWAIRLVSNTSLLIFLQAVDSMDTTFNYCWPWVLFGFITDTVLVWYLIHVPAANEKGQGDGLIALLDDDNE